MRRITIKEQGMKLPIGELKDGVLLKDFSLRPYKGWVDRQLNLYREANQGRSIAYLAAKFMSLVVESAGGVAYSLTESKDSTAEQEFKLHNWYLADFLYAYVYARILAVGEWFDVPVVCPAPKCPFQGTLCADLWTTEVVVLDDPKDLIKTVTLRDGVPVQGKTLKKLRLQPTRYRALLMPGMGQADVNSLSYSQLRESIAEVEGAPAGYILQDSEIDELSKHDMLLLDRQAGEIAAGLDMRTSVTCPKCGKVMREALNWTFDPFFDASVPLGVLTA